MKIIYYIIFSVVTSTLLRPWVVSGAFPVLSLMVGEVVTRLVPEVGPPANITGFDGLSPDQQRVLVASSMTSLVGMFQVGAHLSALPKFTFSPAVLPFK